MAGCCLQVRCFLQAYSVYDEILIHFQNKINDHNGPRDQKLIKEWSEEMRQSVAALAATVPNYYYYLTDYGLNAENGTTPHTFFPPGRPSIRRSRMG
ncbi:hypothetical protein ACFTAO_12150 [Paenibacillus rhizoplanae]